MRFRIASSWKPSVRFRLLIQESVIPVRRLDYGKLGWTWLDGVTYSLTYPFQIKYRQPLWQIESRGRTICTGQMIHPSARDTLLRAANPYIEWNLGGEKTLDTPTCCGGNLRFADGRRLALWRSCWRVEVVCRERHPKWTVPVIVGTILWWNTIRATS